MRNLIFLLYLEMLFLHQVQTLCRDLENVRAQTLELLESTDFAKKVIKLLLAETARRSVTTGTTEDSCCGEQDPRMAQLCVTGFLLAFPYPTAPGTWGSAMLEEVEEAVERSGEELHDELTRLREILAVLMDFSLRS